MSSEVTSPIAGTVWKVLKKVGDSITEDDELFNIEALKMENLVYATASGTIKEIFVSEGDRIDDEQVLAIIE